MAFDWIEECVDYLNRNGIISYYITGHFLRDICFYSGVNCSHPPNDVVTNKVFEIFLDSDMYEIGTGNLPENILVI